MVVTDYKQEHELFLSGHNGTSYIDVAFVTGVSCIACLARDLCLITIVSKLIRPRIISDFILLVLPNIISVTLLHQHIGILYFVILSTSIAYCIKILLFKKSSTRTSLDQVNLDERKTFVTYFRSIVNLCTGVAILAVDFPVFPRRLAKAETYGFGGMDVGVGLFVVANAIVSNEARGKYVTLPVAIQLRKSITSTMPLLILGFARVLAVKGTDYQEHVTEYGVHWNFFFTLAALRVSLTVVYNIISANNSAVAASVVVTIHQVFLSRGLSAYIIYGLHGSGRRQGLIDANREGIYSLPGYIALYMFGVQLGRAIFQERCNLKEWLKFAGQLVSVYTASTFLMTVFHILVEPVSRRMANAAFVFWILNLSILMILQCLLAEVIVTFIRKVTAKPTDTQHQFHDEINHYKDKELQPVSRRKQVQHSLDKTAMGDMEHVTRSKNNNFSSSDGVCLMDAISYNSLFFFLLANVMTGLVNMTVSTIYTSDLYAVVILIVYMFLVSLIVWVLKARNISTKIW